MKWLFGLLASLLCASSALAQTAPMTSFGFISSQYCDSVTTEFPKAPWCYQPKSGLLYLWNGSNGYSVFNGLGSFSVTLGGVVTGASSANVFNSANTDGNTMNNSFIINNLHGYGSYDLEIKPDPSGAAIIGLLTSATSGGEISVYSGSGSGTEGNEIDMLASSTDGSTTVGLLCDSLDNSPNFPGYCYTAYSNLGFQAQTFVFSAIYSAIGTCNSGAEGTLKALNNSSTNTWGATCDDAGSNHVLCYCDGTNWTVMAK